MWRCSDDFVGARHHNLFLVDLDYTVMGLGLLLATECPSKSAKAKYTDLPFLVFFLHLSVLIPTKIQRSYSSLGRTGFL